MPQLLNMDTQKIIVASKEELALVLSFFPRAESKSSVLLAINTGMLAFLAANAPPLREFSSYMLISSALTMVSVGYSVWMLYRGAFPQLAGGHGSLIYFREIANRTEHRFIEEFKNQTEDHHATDVLGQVWRNSEILKIKFDCLKRAFTFTLMSLPAWLITIAMFAAQNSQTKLTLLR